MKQIIKAFIISGILLSVCSAGVEAQTMPQPKVLANMMLQEKKAGKIDDTPYIAYLVDSLGYTMSVDSVKMRRMGSENYQRALKRGHISKVFTKAANESSSRNYSVQIELSSKDEDDGKLLRSIQIKTTNHSMIWWVVVELKKFGLKQTEGEGDFIDLKGKGLFAGTGLKSISIGCWFDKK